LIKKSEILLMIHPTITPITNCSRSSPTAARIESLLLVMNEIRVMVSKTAMGSLLPDSNSSRGDNRPLRFMPRERRMAKTAAASVEEMIAPTSMDSIKLNLRMK